MLPVLLLVPVLLLLVLGTSSTLMSCAITFSTGRAWELPFRGAPFGPIGITLNPARMSTWSPACKNGVRPAALSSGIEIARWLPVILVVTASVGASLKSDVVSCWLG